MLGTYNQVQLYTVSIMIFSCIGQVSKEDADKYPSASKYIPCDVKVAWVGGEEKASYSQFRYVVEFHGAVEKSYFLAVTLPTFYLRK